MTVLTPFEKQSDQDRLKDYIDEAKQLPMFRGGSIQFDAIVWDLRGYVNIPNSKTHTKIGFKTLETGGRRALADMEPLPQPLQDTAKAIVAHAIHRNGSDLKSPATYFDRLAAIKHLCRFLTANGSSHDLTKISAGTIRQFINSVSAQLHLSYLRAIIKELNSRNICLHLSGISFSKPKRNGRRA
uniref:hypothetical protein n=1 Tax=Palleronia sp. TaxID=1940284 RepID=UPI0035C87B27